MNKLELLKEQAVFEAVFRNGGYVEVDVETEQGEKAGTERIDYTIREFLSTKDASHLFPRTVSNQMREAGEPILAISSLLEEVRLNTTASTVDYYALGAIQAHEIPEGGEYPEEKAVWAKAARTAKVTKKGLRVPITQELIDDDLFDVVGMYLRAAGRAMARYKEKLAAKRLLEAASLSDAIVFDNDDPAKPDTTGVGRNGSPNGTLDGMDLLQACGAMIATGRTPTHIVMHPLAWAMFAYDPIVRALAFSAVLGFNGPRGSYDGGGNDAFAKAVVSATLGGAMQANLGVITSPHVPYDPATRKTDIILVDANDLGVITMREPLTTDQFDDPLRDIVALKVKERYDITIMDSDGVNVVAIKNVVVDRNYGTDVTFTKEIA